MRQSAEEESRRLDVGVLSSRLLSSFQRELFRRLAAQGHDKIRPAQGAVLAHLDEQGTRATDLAARAGGHKQVVGRVLDELEELGYVQRVPDPSDRRAKLVVPTGLGLDQMHRAAQLVDQIEAEYRAQLGDDQWQAFLGALARVAEIAAADSPDQPA